MNNRKNELIPQAKKNGKNLKGDFCESPALLHIFKVETLAYSCSFYKEYLFGSSLIFPSKEDISVYFIYTKRIVSMKPRNNPTRRKAKKINWATHKLFYWL